MATKKQKVIKTEWERKRDEAESEAISEGSFHNKREIMVSRAQSEGIVASVGLNPERVWQLTRSMRKAENGGER